jgi:hypothetical protein
VMAGEASTLVMCVRSPQTSVSNPWIGHGVGRHGVVGMTARLSHHLKVS